MRKKIIAGFLALTLVMGSAALPSGVFENVAEKTSITASAYDSNDGHYYVSGDYKYGILDDGTVDIVKYTGSSTSVIIPSTLGGDKVTSIGFQTFRNCTSIKNVTIPNGITSIGESAFQGCTSLKNIKIPNSVTRIGVGALYDTAWYDNQANAVVYAGKVAYAYKGEMPKNTSITLKSGTVGIADYAFYGYKSLASITIPNSVSGIGDFAFWGCTSLKSVTISSGVTNIGTGAFEDCTNLSSITIPKSVVKIGSNAFNNTAWYDKQADGVVYAGKVAYIYKGRMPKNTSITLKSGTVGIAGYAFYECTDLISIKIPNSVTNIEWYAFYGCTSLKSISIPNKVTRISSSTFYCCKSLKSVTISNSVTSIEYMAFGGCTSIKSITIPNSVKCIAQEAFDGCTGLKSITIPSGVTSIGKEAFGYYCDYKSQKNVKVSGFTITCYYDSAAGVYARKNGFACKYLHNINGNTVKLSKTSYSYSGKANKPAVTIMCGKAKLKNGKDYTCTYKNNKAIGTASVVIKGKGKYNGTKTVTFKINPKKQTAKLTSYNDAFKASWTKDSQATGYQVMYAKSKTFKGSKTYTVNAKTLSKKIKGKNKVTYYVKIRTYKTVNGKTYCGAWSTAKAVKTK